LGGEQAHTLILNELPSHNHLPTGSTTAANSPTPVSNVWASAGQTVYAASPNNTMNAAALLPVGGSQPHDNMSPYLVLNFIIALQGIFPSRN